MLLSPDFAELLTAFADARVEYLIVGGYAVAHHAQPRFTKDLDLLIGSSPDNLARVERALSTFGVPPQIIGELLACGPDEIVWFGQPPLRVDLLKSIPGVDFSDAWPRRTQAQWDGVPVQILSREDLIVAKRASGRSQDQLDLESLT